MPDDTARATALEHTSAIDRGRARLAAWRDAGPGNWFIDNAVLRALLVRLAPSADAAALARIGEYGAAIAAAEPLVHRVSHDPCLPTLERFDAVGRRCERVRFDGAYHEMGRLVYGSGVMGLTGQPGRAVEQALLVILTAHHGEGGHTCPLACTAGLIRAVQQVGHPALQRSLLPGLLDPDYGRRLHGAQFLTEIQGGSDVGANATRATLLRGESATLPALWAIDGEKWFCSVVDAPLYVVTARPQGAPDGTRGLGLFVVPHDLPAEGAVAARALSHSVGAPPNPVNHFAIRRLKHKLGTRAMASGEVDWHGAHAWQLGPVDRGFHNTVDIVLNTSRLFNALACAGMLWRAYYEAAGFAVHREAFGVPVARFASTDQALAQLFAEAAAASASTLDLAAAGEDRTLAAATRIGVNMNKYWTSVRATQMVRQAMEVLAGNAAIEDFTPLGRLYRDCMVTEAWEGTHNVLAAQTWRDMAKLRLHDAWLHWLAPRAAALRGALADRIADRMGRLGQDAAQLLAASDPARAVLATRAWMEDAMVAHQAVCLAELAQGLDAPLPAAVVDHWLALHVPRTAVSVDGWWPGRAA
ncbi:MAG: acyl-CoA dehydrogenase family protein [Deltaproteobacteria bacterium]|nr:acyl-CoA dehydrogenase family protein [Deltaproteobacteria bacterium]